MSILIRHRDRLQRPYLAFILLLIAVVVGALGGLLGVASLFIVGPILLFLCLVWPVFGASMLLVTCALDRFTFTVGGVNVRFDEVAALLLGGALVLRWALTPRFAPVDAGLRPVGLPLVVPLSGYMAANLLATVAMDGSRVRAASLDLLTLDLLILCWALACYVSTPARLMWALRLWVVVAVAEGLIGAAAFALYLRAHTAVPGVQLDPVSGAPLVYGTLSEGNIFGSYIGASLLVALALAFGSTGRKRPFLYGACAVLAGALLLSNTRSAWGATAIGAALLPLVSRLGRMGRVGGEGRGLFARYAGGLVLIVAIIGVGLMVVPKEVSSHFTSRAAQLLNFGSGSGYGRLQLYNVALNEWRAHPLLGVGPGSFSFRLPGDLSSGPAWLPNLTLQALHDAGIIGLLALVVLVVAFYVTMLRALYRAPVGDTRAALSGLIAAMTALFVAFQLTPGFVLGYPWALLGLALGATRLGATSQIARLTDESRAAPRRA